MGVKQKKLVLITFSLVKALLKGSGLVDKPISPLDLAHRFGKRQNYIECQEFSFFKNKVESLVHGNPYEFIADSHFLVSSKLDKRYFLVKNPQASSLNFSENISKAEDYVFSYITKANFNSTIDEEIKRQYRKLNELHKKFNVEKSSFTNSKFEHPAKMWNRIDYFTKFGTEHTEQIEKYISTVSTNNNLDDKTASFNLKTPKIKILSKIAIKSAKLFNQKFEECIGMQNNIEDAFFEQYMQSLEELMNDFIQEYIEECDEIQRAFLVFSDPTKFINENKKSILELLNLKMLLASYFFNSMIIFYNLPNFFKETASEFSYFKSDLVENKDTGYYETVIKPCKLCFFEILKDQEAFRFAFYYKNFKIHDN